MENVNREGGGCDSIREVSIHRSVIPGIVLLLGMMPGCNIATPENYEALEATRAVEATLTAAHESEVRSLIESYYILSHSFYAQRDPSRLSQVATGPWLETLISNARSKSRTSLDVIRAITIDEVHVLEYTSSVVKVIGCGDLYLDVVTLEGQPIESLPRISFKNVYVFVQEEGRWKLFTHYYFGDPDDALRDWEYVSEEEKQAIGDLSSYIDLYFSCGISP